MSTLPCKSSVLSAPPGLWFTSVAGVGLVWNLFGALQFVRSVTADEVGLVASGMTSEQAAVMTAFPTWVALVFGIGVVTSLVGGVLMVLRRRVAALAMGISLIAFVLLWIAYAWYGAFAAFGTPQVAIMSTVVAVAAGLYAASLRIAAAPAS